MKVTPATTHKKSSVEKEVEENSFPVVAIGASAGGLEAITELLKNLPSDTGMSFIYVQHLSPDHKSMLTEILSKQTKMKVQEIDDMDKIKPNNVFIIPHNKGIEVTDGHIKLIPRAENSSAISIDVLFSSLAHAQKERVIGIILSGSASDGTVGMKDIKQEGGLTFAQDKTAKFSSMPQSAIAAGVVDFILSPKEIALELSRLSKHPFIKSTGNGKIPASVPQKGAKEDLIDNSNPDLKIILNHLRRATGVDFSQYKMTTIKRRIIRRMLLYKIETLKEYAKYIDKKNEEIDILYQDLLINVTSFFRDNDTHKYLKETLFPRLLNQKKTGEALRIWVPACASGEEAYSLAIMLLEIQDSIATKNPIQIFATDLSVQAIQTARIGLYSKEALETVSPKRIQHFFTKADGGYRINKSVREICVFAPHNVLTDPPFSRLDFISCCNLFIYFDNAAQKKAVNTFHYALNDDGYLMLGKSESISQSANLFTVVNKKYKIFSRKLNSGIRTLPQLSQRFANQTLAEKNIPAGTNKTKRPSSNPTIEQLNNVDSAIDAVLLSEFMPASVAINHAMEIVQFRGATNLFLTHPKGKANLNILKMARPEIGFELRNAIAKALKTKKRVHKSGIEIKTNATVQLVSIEVRPLKIESDEPLLLVVFREQEQTGTFSQQGKSGPNNSLAKDRRIKKLEEELAAAHADALAFSQDQEAYTEELQSASEEIVSSNEELQTVNEELETSKEEIESANEELITTNQELQMRNDQLNDSYDYKEAVVDTIHDSMIVLDKNLRIVTASKSFYKNFGVTDIETEGMLLYDLGNRQWNIPRLREFLEDIVPKNSHFEDFEVTHNFPHIGEKIMLLNASRIIQKTKREPLILLSIQDITDMRDKANELQAKEKKFLSRFQNLLMEAPAIVCVLRGPTHIYELANANYMQVVGHRPVVGKPIREALPELEGQGIFEILDAVYKTGKSFIGNEMLVKLDKGKGKVEECFLNFVYQASYNEGEIDGILVYGVDVTEQVNARKKIEENEQRLRLATETSGVGIWEWNVITNKIRWDAQMFRIYGVTPTADGFVEYQVWCNAVVPEDLAEQERILQDTVKNTGSSKRSFKIFRANDGMLCDIEAIETVRTNAAGQAQWVVGTNLDVTEQVNARKEIKESEQRFQAAIKAVQGILWTNNAKGEMEGEQAGWASLTGQAYEEYQGYGWAQAVHPDDAEPSVKAWNEAVKERKTFIFEHRVKRKDGQWRDFSIRAIPLVNADGTLLQWVGVHTDITESKQAAKALKANEEKLNIVIEASELGTYELNLKTKEPTYSKRYLEILGGYKEDIQLTHAQLLQHLHPDDFLIREKAFKEAMDSGYLRYEARLIWKDGSIHWMEGRGKVFYDEKNNPENLIGTIRDITEEKNHEQELQESEERFRTVADSAPVLIWMSDTDKLCYFFNKGWLHFTGRTMEQELGNGWAEGVHPDDLQKCLDIYISSFDKRVPFYMEYRLKRHDGEYRWLSDNGVPRFTSNGEFEGYIGACMDINNERVQQQALEESEEKFRLLADSMPQHIWTSDPEGNLNYYNQSVFDFSGLNLEQINKDGWIQIVHPDDREENIKQWLNAISTGNDFLFEHRFRRHDGEYRWQLSRAIPQRDANGKIQMWVGTSTDIQEQKTFTKELELQVSERTTELEASNNELQKMNKELQSFAYISSHDLQEPLRKIQTFATRIKEKEENNLSDSGRDMFNRMQDAAKRMQTLIQDLLAYSRSNTTERKLENTDLNKIIAEVKEDLKEELNEKQATIEANQLCYADIIPFQFRQLLHNLIGNSLKFSKPEIPPHITIKSEIANGLKFENEKLSLQKKYCHISVSDNGIGFESHFSEKIFEVFQRLHGNDKYAGTGIGLAIVKKIVENHNGIITAKGEPNEGVTFDIYIPAT